MTFLSAPRPPAGQARLVTPVDFLVHNVTDVLICEELANGGGGAFIRRGVYHLRIVETDERRVEDPLLERAMNEWGIAVDDALAVIDLKELCRCVVQRPAIDVQRQIENEEVSRGGLDLVHCSRHLNFMPINGTPRILIKGHEQKSGNCQ